MHNGRSPKGLWVVSTITGGELFDCRINQEVVDDGDDN